MLGKRLIELRKKLGYKSVTSFAEHLGVKRPTLASYENETYPPSADFLTILNKKDSVNLNWLLTGHGAVFQNNTEDSVALSFSELDEQEICSPENCTVQLSGEQIPNNSGNMVMRKNAPEKSTVQQIGAKMRQPERMDEDGEIINERPRRNFDGLGVPYYDIEATAHIASVFSEGEIEPEFYVDFKPFNDCTAFLPVYGNSMFPAIQSGEIIAVKEIKNLDVILWGEMYLIIANSDQNDLRAVKTIHQHADDSKIILRSSNPDFRGDTIIPKESIIKIFLVKGKISRNHL